MSGPGCRVLCDVFSSKHHDLAWALPYDSMLAHWLCVECTDFFDWMHQPANQIEACVMHKNGYAILWLKLALTHHSAAKLSVHHHA